MRYAAHETELWKSAGMDVPSLALLWEASMLIHVAIEHRRATIDLAVDDPIEDVLGAGLLFGFRAIRAVGVLVATGYSAEAQSGLRRVAELAALATRVLEPGGQDIAERWAREQMSPSKLLDRDLNSALSVSAHAHAAHLGAITVTGLNGPETNLWSARSQQDSLVALGAAQAAHELLVACESYLGVDAQVVLRLTAAINEAAPAVVAAGSTDLRRTPDSAKCEPRASKMLPPP